MYKLTYNSRVVKKLKSIHPRDQRKVLSTLKVLATNPKDLSLNIKKLVNTEHSLRIRMGKIRVIFEADHKSKKLYILDVDYRGNIY